ncbi:ABC transporter permease [Tuwongella immobilis]|uniref:ABC transmembrane type-1 domain-containing protein n=1 Tax=Tuwongella immobilis TaxID=692036 RepID=A0A6C2YL43_9BACT|nr:ABC transporter permease [Tuwongella immobilis]VIP01833.1 -like abc-type porter : NifC-like ABC-type porter OS=Rhodopirellula maiorica SM1 GN=RMSM_03318 PE=3 SV=1: BPD_transp_1 [Tuwongella immobilis]VTR99587.1 -like abc-type porter : NifC-like ABC-type porter OS=Rhodopirellula maiorica SM1 GN=RMSM_03318 PE=3 SV=1: BPD_transp_1 [Tuwongella immobilis]
MIPARQDRRFLVALAVMGGWYLLLIAAMLVADVLSTPWNRMLQILQDPAIRYALRLSLATATTSTLIALTVAIPLGYLLARERFMGRPILQAIVEIPLVLPPTVVGLSLLVLFESPWGRIVQTIIPVTYAVPGIIVAQVTVITAFAVHSLQTTFRQLDPRTEHVARTLGCTRWQAVTRIVLPEAKSGILAASLLAWTRALGEFGPILVLCGVTRFRTEVLATSVYLEWSTGQLDAALAVALLLAIVATSVLLTLRFTRPHQT